MKATTTLALISGALLLSANASRAQLIYFANAQTDPNTTVRLFLDTAETTAAPVGTAVWLFADISGNGIGIAQGQVPVTEIQNIINGVGDDQRFFSDIVDGGLLGAQPGKYQRTGISVPDAFQTARIGLLLVNDANHNSTIGDAGDTFGYYDFGVVPPPAVGNALYLISGNVHADQNLIVPVPEPAQMSIAFGMICLAGALVHRTRRGLPAL